jgi:hypothetical protein
MRTTATLLSLPLLFCLALLSSCDAGYSRPSSYEEVKMTLEEQEQQSPTDFLKAEGTYRENLIGQWVLEGNIVSSATVAHYKDVVVTVNYYSKTETLLASDRYTLYEFITPGERQAFKLKTEGYQGTKAISMEVSDAVAME